MTFVSVSPAVPAAPARLPAFAQAYVAWFWGLFALSAVHRLVASLPVVQDTVMSFYSPGTRGESFRIWADIYRDATLLGLAQDVLFSALAALVFAGAGRWLRSILLLALCLFLSANAVHIRYNLTHIDLSTIRHGANPAFIAGMFDIGFLLVAAMFAGVAHSLANLLRAPAATLAGGALIPCVVGLALFAAPAPSFVHPGWMQSHPLLRDPVSGPADPDPKSLPAAAFAYRPPPPAVAGGYNLLVLYLEGLSGHSVADGSMEQLRSLADRSLSFDRVFGAQLITANGLYATLTGDLPNFVAGQLRWDRLDPGSGIAGNAVPNRLRQAGYRTAFLQSAPLDYMSKDTVLPLLGFETVLGRSAWAHAHSEDGWGIDDRALFENVVAYIDGLEQGAPWFVAALTTGTHPPYNVPADFMPETPRSRDVALRYLDAALAELVAALDARGLLETTVVVITSDESRERVTGASLAGQIALNWLPMIVLHPSGDVAHVATPISSRRFGEVVLPLLDPARPAGAADPGPAGPVVFGNTYANRLYVYDPAETSLLVCVTSTFSCADFTDVDDPVTVGDAYPASVTRRPAIEAVALGRETPD